MGGQLSIATGLKLQGHSTSLKAQYLPSASTVSQMRFICLFTMYDATFQRFLMLHVKLGAVVRGLDPLFDPFCIWGNKMSMNINQVKKLRKIVRM